MSVGALLDRLRADATRAGTGTIRVDEALALRKLREHRLAEPHHYVLELLRAAAASGATHVRIRNDADELEMSFDGDPFPEAELPRLFGHALAGAAHDDRDATRLRLLALGVVGALGLHPKELVVETPSLRLDVTTDRVAASPRSRAKASPAATTRIYVRERLGWRVVGKALRRTPPESVAIRERTTHYGPRIELNGSALSPEPSWGASGRHAVEVEAGGRRIRLALVHGVASRVQIATHGVTVTERAVELPGIVVAGWASDEKLRTNASGSDVVEGPELDALLAAVESAAVEAVRALTAASDAASRDEVAALARVLGLGRGAPREVAAPRRRGSKVAPEIGKLLRAAPLFPGPGGERWSLDAVLPPGAARPELRVLMERCDRGLYDGPILLWPALSPAMRELLAGVPHLDVGAEIAEGRDEARARAAFERQPVERPELAAGDDLTRRMFAKGKWKGEVAISRSGSGAVVRFLHQGRFVEQRDVAELHPLALRAVVDAADLPPDPRGRGIAKDAPAGKVIAAVREVALEAVADLLEGGSREPPAEIALVARHALAAGAAGRKAPDALLRARVIPLAGGGAIALEQLRKLAKVRWVGSASPHGALDGEPVVVLSTVDQTMLARWLHNVPLVPWDEQLARELEVRTRLKEERIAPVVVEDLVVKVRVQGLGVAGELALLPEGPDRIRLTLLRQGFALERARITDTAAPMAAVLEVPDLRPLPGWDGAVKDGVREGALEAVRGAVPELLPALARERAGVLLDALPGGAHRLVARAIRRHARALAGSGAGRRDARQEPDAELAAVLALSVTGTGGRSTVADLVAESRASGALLTVPTPGELDRLGGEGLRLFLVPDVVAEALAEVLGVRRDAGRLAAAAAFRRQHEEKPERPWRLPEKIDVFHEHVAKGGLRVLVGHERGGNPGIALEVHWRRRTLAREHVAHALPLTALVALPDELQEGDLDAGSLSDQLSARIEEALQQAAVALVTDAVARARKESVVTSPAYAALALDAIGAGMRRQVQGLLELPLFPLLGGGWARGAALGAFPVPAVASGSGLQADVATPIVVLGSDRIERALQALGGVVDVTENERSRAKARARFARKAQVEEIAVAGRALARRRIARDGVEGEIAIVSGARPEVEVFLEHRSLVTKPLDCPVGTRAAIQADALRPTADLRDVVDAAAMARVERHLQGELDQLLAEKAEVPTDDRRILVASILAPFLPWLARRSGRRHPLMRAPLFTTTLGEPTSLEALEGSRPGGTIAYSKVAGAAPRSAGIVLHPRKGELALLETVGRLEDVTWAVTDLAERRARRKRVPATVPGSGRFREPVVLAGGPGEGEVVLDALPSGQLSVELVVDGYLVESLAEPHPVGARARVAWNQLRVDDDELHVVRDRELARVRQGVESALERAVARLLSEGRAADVQAWLPGSLAWRLDGAGPVAEALRRVAPFRDLSGASVTIGAVLAEQDEHGELHAIGSDVEGDPSWPIFPAGRRILVVDEPARQLLRRLAVSLRDDSEAATRHAAAIRRRAGRRLKSRRYEGDAVTRLAVDQAGWKGELALPMGDLARCRLVLAKEGLAVDEYRQGQLVLAGVLDGPLPVDAAGERADLDEATRGMLASLVERLFEKLAATARDLRAAERRAAAFHALRYVASSGAKQVADLDRVDRAGGLARELARTPLFESAELEWHDLMTLAALAAGGQVVVVSDAKGAGLPVLRAGTMDEPWVKELEGLLGKKGLARIAGQAALKAYLARLAPPPGSPLATGLDLVRRETERRAGPALVKSSLVRSIAVERAGGALPFHIDEAHGELRLDLDHPGLHRALESRDGEAIQAIAVTLLGAALRASGGASEDAERRLVRACLAG